MRGLMVVMLMLAGAAVFGALPVSAPEPDAESVFFDALNARPERRTEALVALRQRILVAPGDGRVNLLLGMAYLWVAAESPPAPEQAREHLVLARHYLEAARRLNPADDRIPSWLWSAEASLAAAEGREDDARAAMSALRAQAERDPCFHSVAYAICAWEGDRAEFDAALKLLERAAACGAEDPSVRNLPRWPHNVHGFLVALSDYYLKAGDPARAEGALFTAQGWDGYDAWPHRREVEVRFKTLADRAAKFADGDPSNDPAFVLGRGGAVSCVVCHQGAR